MGDVGDNRNPFFSNAERAFLEALNQLGVEYLVVGMSAALLQGARGATEDIDLWFRQTSDDRIGEAADRAGGFWVTQMQPPLLGGNIGDRFDVVTFVSGIDDFDQEYQDAATAVVEGVELKLLRLDRILHSKKKAARVKDAPGIQQIEVALRVIEKTEGEQ